MYSSKLIFALTLLWQSASADYLRRELQATCPTPSPDLLCPKVLQPVTCTGDCSYSNPCLAAASGFDKDADCKLDAAPVNAVYTVYNNYTFDRNCTCPLDQPECEACQDYTEPSATTNIVTTCLCPPDDITCVCENSGTANQAATTCPPIDASIPCPAGEQTKLLCGPDECFYPGSCEATNAGWNPTTECKPKPLPFPENWVCPSYDRDVMCEPSLFGYTCSGPTAKDCYYGSFCLAEAAGWSIGSQCKAISKNVTYDDQGCPSTESSWSCTAAYAPLFCKSSTGGVCEYPNECIALGNGWTDFMQCEKTPIKIERKICPLSMTMDIPCDSTPRKWSCSRDQYEDCEYDNHCLAVKAGFKVKQQCVLA